MKLFEPSDRLTGFSVTFGGDRAGVYDIDICLLGGICYNEPVPFKILSHCLSFILINLAAQGEKCGFHILPPY